MKKSNILSALFSAFAGAMLALVVMFSANAFTTQVRAEPPDDGADYWCPGAPPPGCNPFGCLVRYDGSKLCKFIAQENGADCTTNQTCVKSPGGGILIE